MPSVQPRALQKIDIGVLADNLFEATDTIGLFQAGPIVGPTTQLSDLTEATFIGYARVALPLAWLRGLDPLGNGIAKYPGSLAFVAGALTATEVEGGWFIVDVTGVVLKACANFNGTFSFANEDDTLLVQPFLFAAVQGGDDDEFISGA